MKNLLCSAVFLLSIFVAAAQDTIIAKNLQPFGTISLDGGIWGSIQQIPESAPASLSICLNGNNADQVKWSIKDSVLSIRFSGTSRSNLPHVTIHYHQVGTLKLDAASVHFSDSLGTSLLSFLLQGGAKLTADVSCDDLVLDVQGKSSALLRGETRYLTIKARNSAVDTRELNAVSTTLEASAISEAFVYGSERLVLEARDGASIFYRGNPAILRKNTLRSGRINYIGQ